MTDRPRDEKLDFGSLLDNKNVEIEVKKAESPDERKSRLKREEAQAEHAIRKQEAEDAHARRIAWSVHIFGMAVVATAFLASVYMAVALDPKTGLPDKAVGIITAIVAASVGYMMGKGSK